MRNKAWILLMGLILFITTSCKEDEGSTISSEKKTYKVAVVMPFSSGSPWSRTIDWALANLEEAQRGLPQIADIKVELKDENDADLADYLAQVANDESYAAIIGPYSSENATKAAQACAKSQKTLVLPLATSTEFQRSFADKDYVWNLAQSDLTQCEILLMQAAISESLSVSLLTSDDDYGKSFSDWFAYQAVELGLQVKEVRIYHDKSDIKSEVEHFDDERFRGSTLIFAPSNTSDFLAFDEAYTTVSKSHFTTVYCSDVAHSQALVGKAKNAYEGISPSAAPGSGFINAYRNKFGVEPMAGEAHLYDAIQLLGYALASTDGTHLNESIKDIVDGRDAWNKSWLPSDMHEALVRLQAGGHPDLNGVTGDWTFDEKHHASVLNSSYAHWILKYGKYQTLEYLSTDGSGRTTSSLQIWQEDVKHFQQFNQQQEDIKYGEKKGNWAVVIGTSDTWANYRHQADAIAMYQILKRHGYDDDHIIMIIADNIAYDSHNLHQGVVKVTPDGENLYHDMQVDYKINDITPNDLRSILMGESSDKLPQVVNSTKDDNIIIFWCGHGNPNSLAWGAYNDVYGWQIRNILQEMNEQNRYRKMFFAMDACYSGTIGEACEGIPGILFMTAANAYEPSKADMKDPEMGIWLSNGFTRAFQEAIDETPDISLRDLYYKLARQTVGSHATVYNATSYGNMYTNTMSEYLK